MRLTLKTAHTLKTQARPEIECIFSPWFFVGHPWWSLEDLQYFSLALGPTIQNPVLLVTQILCVPVLRFYVAHVRAIAAC